MTSHYCPNCNQKIDIPPHYIGKTVACPQCKVEFIPGNLTLKPKVEVKEQKIRKQKDKRSFKLTDLWCGISSTGRIGIIALLLIIIGCAVGVPAYLNNQKYEEYNVKYQEFVFEADQLANLTSFGVNKGDFTRQLSRVKAKLDSVSREFFVTDKGDVYSTFNFAMDEWKQVVKHWDLDGSSREILVGISMKTASDFYQQGKESMKQK